MITWRRLRTEDFPMLRDWLSQEHVARWWNHETSPGAVERDFGAAARGEEPSEDLVALLDGTPLGLVQRSRLSDYAEDLAEYGAFVEDPGSAMTVDYLIGDPAQVGRGLGPRMIRSIVADTWARFPDITAIVVGVVAANTASWRALEKAGFTKAGEADMEPDNPIDDPRHVMYRVTRPA